MGEEHTMTLGEAPLSTPVAATRVPTDMTYRAAFEAVGVGIALIKPQDGVIVFCNPAYARLLGFLPEKLTGRSFFELLDAEQRNKALDQRNLRLEGLTSYEIVVTVAQGTATYLLATGAPLYNDDGSHAGTVQTLVDVTEARHYAARLWEGEKLYRTTFNAIPAGLAHVAPDGSRLLSVNDL